MASERLTAPLLITAGAIWPPVCAAVVALRFYTRRAQNIRLGPDDWLTIPALVCHHAASWAKGRTRLMRCGSIDFVDRNVCLGTSRYIAIKCSTLPFSDAHETSPGVALHSAGYPTPKPASPYAELHFASYQQQTTRKVRKSSVIKGGMRTIVDNMLGLVLHRVDANTVSGLDQAQLHVLLQAHLRQGQRQSLQSRHTWNSHTDSRLDYRILLQLSLPLQDAPFSLLDIFGGRKGILQQLNAVASRIRYIGLSLRPCYSTISYTSGMAPLCPTTFERLMH